jgi:ATP-binding cassette subfamily F protein 3
MVKQAVGTMSGGEKARLVLAMIVWQRPNLLLLDEPTNHLDLATREALSMALNEFEGTVMLVSHDRALLRAVCDEFWMVGRGKVEPFDGDLDDYQKYLLDESKRLREEAKYAERDSAVLVSMPLTQVLTPAIAPVAYPAAAAAENGISSAEQRKLDAQKRQQLAAHTRPLKRELEQNEQRLANIEAEKSQLEQLLTTHLPPAEIAEAGRRLKALADEVTTLEERWLELTSLLEEAISI